MTSGVYIIYNTISNSFYIGSSKNIEKRLKTHLRKINNNSHINPILINAFNKYDKKDFIYSILKTCVENDILYWEQYYIDKYNPEYNIAKNVCAPMKGRKHKKETIAKFKNRKVSKGKNHYMKQIGPSDSHRKNMSKSRKKHKWSEETKKKMSQTAKKLNSISRINHNKKKKPVIDSNGNRFDSLKSAAKFWNISFQAICDNLKGRSEKTKIGVTFKYENP
tara:strand:+ start:1517 stop:2179 length:663 start_codon:yes stop_codon:yes gene_type:complete